MVSHSCPVVERAYEAYARRDLETAATCLAEDIVFALYLDRSVVPFGGVSIGKRVFLERCSLIFDLFDTPVYRLENLVVDGDEVRAQITYGYRHRASGVPVEGTMRHTIMLRDDLIARLDEFHDRARFEAFMRLVEGTVGATDVPVQSVTCKGS